MINEALASAAKMLQSQEATIRVSNTEFNVPDFGGDLLGSLFIFSHPDMSPEVKEVRFQVSNPPFDGNDLTMGELESPFAAVLWFELTDGFTLVVKATDEPDYASNQLVPSSQARRMIRFPGLTQHQPIYTAFVWIAPEGRTDGAAGGAPAWLHRPADEDADFLTVESLNNTDEAIISVFSMLIPERWMETEAEEDRLRANMYDTARYVTTTDGPELFDCRYDATLGIPIDPSDPFLCDWLNDTNEPRRVPVSQEELLRSLNDSLPQLNDPGFAIDKDTCESLLAENPDLIGGWLAPQTFEPDQLVPSCGFYHQPVQTDQREPQVIYRFGS